VSRAEAALLHAGTWLAAASGAVYFWMKYMMQGSDPFSALHHPWQPQMLALHVLAAPILVFALGLIARGHVVEGYREEKPHPARLSGVATVLPALPMIATGYLIQVVAGPGIRRSLVMTHLLTGGLFALLFAAHVGVGWLRRARNGAAGGEAPVAAPPCGVAPPGSPRPGGHRLDRPRGPV
jgi:hypothetical protein